MAQYFDEGGAVYNVMAPSYGVDNTGATNTRPEIKLIIDSMTAGGVLYFPSGTYAIGLGQNGEDELEIPEDVCLQIASGAHLRMWEPGLMQNQVTKLKIKGSLDVGLYPVFDLEENGTLRNPAPVAFDPGTVPCVRPEWFGAKASNFWLDDAQPQFSSTNVFDCTAAIQAAVASLPRSGGVIQFSPGQYGIRDEVLITTSGVVLQGSPRQGGLFGGQSRFGSMLVLQQDMPTKSMVRFAARLTGKLPVSACWGSGVKGMSFCEFPAARTLACDAAVHVDDCVAFTLQDCTFENLKGSALRVTSATQCSFDNLKIKDCGDGVRRPVTPGRAQGHPAVWIEASGEPGRIVQGSVFTGFKIEVCHGAPYLQIDEGNPANKFDDIGFENNPAETGGGQIFLRVQADHNQFGKLHFNRQEYDAAGPKLVIDANDCQFGELIFRGRHGHEGSLRIEEGRAGNSIGAVSVSKQTFKAGTVEATHYLSMTQIDLAGDRNRVGRIRCEYGPIVIGGEGNVVDDVGYHGIFVDDGQPLTMTDWTVRNAGQADPNNGHCGLYAVATNALGYGAVCARFRILDENGKHAYSFWIDDATSGGPSYSGWQIQGNTIPGGAVKIPGASRVDLDAEGMGPDLTGANSMTLPDSCNVYKVVLDSVSEIRSITASWKGRRAVLVFDDAFTIKDQYGNLKLDGGQDLSVAANDTLTLVCDDTDWYQVATTGTSI